MASKKQYTPNAAITETDIVGGSTDLAVVDELVETGIVAATSLPGLALDDFDYGTDYQGSEIKLKADEVIIPMLKIVQESSKIWKERDVNTCNFKLGDIYNTVTKQTYDGATGVLLVPIDSRPFVIERKPAPVGTFMAKHSSSLDEKKGGEPRIIKAYNDNGKDGWKKLEGKGVDGSKVQFNFVEEVHVVLIDPTDGVTALGVALVPFSGTNVFPRKKWWFAMGEVLGSKATPKYAFRTVLRTVFRAGANGGVDSYMFEAVAYGGNWSKCRLGASNKVTLDRCREFEQLVDSGALGKVDYSDADDSEAAQEAAVFKADF